VSALNIPYRLVLGQAVVEEENQVVEEPRVVVSGVEVGEKKDADEEVAFQAEEVAKVVVQLTEESVGYRVALEFLVSDQVELLKQV
jgi:hypothetical protein